MKIGGFGFREHVRFLAPLFGILTGVWALRIVFASAGVPQWLVLLASLTVVAPASVLLAALLIHVRRFGGYSNVVVASFLLNSWANLLIILAIGFSVVSGFENVYTAPEFSLPTDDAYHLRHIYGHLTFGIGMHTIAGAAVGGLLLWLLRKADPVNADPPR